MVSVPPLYVILLIIITGIVVGTYVGTHTLLTGLTSLLEQHQEDIKSQDKILHILDTRFSEEFLNATLRNFIQQDQTNTTIFETIENQERIIDLLENLNTITTDK